MPIKNVKRQTKFHYHTADSETTVTRRTAKRLTEHLGVDETKIIHRALNELAASILPQYEPDDGPLSAAQVRQIRKSLPQRIIHSIRSSLFDLKSE